MHRGRAQKNHSGAAERSPFLIVLSPAGRVSNFREVLMRNRHRSVQLLQNIGKKIAAGAYE